MSAANFAPALALILAYEWGYVDDPKDPGGCTNLGITRQTLSEWRGHACSCADVRALTRADVQPIYQAVYWGATAGDGLPAGVDLICFDGAVNQGQGAMPRMLQRAVGVTVDGQIGAKTIFAVAAVPPVAMIERLRVARLAAYKDDAGFAHDGKGWLTRLAGVAHTATSWATKAAA